eukprot:CAMPEP_0174262536 /NCGR_PEP_ID=MMETSP0439-20130205/13261_1 /TAXON_ID=0 /ORGANISM="Stereomyxa ramosa, Strain Chinc5" /LENGTH=84 /DNA_ID=CAMNT_0015347267 /DNA_START=33 /DNA_END=287 /DNA_ORIENTATION=+
MSNSKDHYTPIIPADEKTIFSDPIVAAGMFGTGGVLGTGLYQFLRGNSKGSNQLMRGRVLFQFVTVGLLCGAIGYGAWGGSSNK